MRSATAGASKRVGAVRGCFLTNFACLGNEPQGKCRGVADHKMRMLRFLLFGIGFIFPLYWTAQFALYVLPEVLRAAVLRQPLSVLEVSYLRATASVSNTSSLGARGELLLTALLLVALLYFFRGHRYLAGSLGLALVGQSALLPFTSSLLSGEGESVGAVLGGLLAFAILCLGVQATLVNMGPVGFAGRVAGISVLLILPEGLLWLVFLRVYPYFGWDFLGLLLAPVAAAALLVCVLLRRDLRHDTLAPPMVEIWLGFTLTALFVAGVGLSNHALKQERASEWQAFPLCWRGAPCEKPLGMLLLSFPVQVAASNEGSQGTVDADAKWENVAA